MNWLKRLFGVKTDFEIMLEHMRASDESKNELIRTQMGIIDRVVAARYDRPTLATEPMTAAPETYVEDLVDVNVEDDEWLARQ